MCTADLPTVLPTRLPQDNQRLGSSTFLRPLFAVRHASLGSAFASPSLTRLGIDANMVVPEYQPVVHRLRLSPSP